MTETIRPGEGITVALFATCINDTMFPETPKATVAVLERLGCRVEFPRAQTCCGQIFTNTGYFDESTGSILTYLEAFEGYDYIIGPSGSCVGAIRHQHPMLADRLVEKGEMAESVAERVAALAKKTYDFPEFIIDVLGVENVGAYFPHRVTYHPTCHSLRVTKVGDRPYRLLKAVRGLDLVELPDADRCCGFGGTFSMKNPDVSVSMASDKARHVASTGAEFLVAGDNSCLLNISGILARQQSGIQPMHLAEILAQTEEGVSQ